MARRIYLDHNARAPLHPAARDAMACAMGSLDGNPSSQHAEGQRARASVEHARESVGRLLGARAKDVAFTSGATESIHLALHGALRATSRKRVLTFGTEHHAVLDEVKSLGSSGTLVGVHPDGTPDVEALDRALSDDVAVLLMMAANNETGVLTDTAPLVALARARGVFTVVDAAQVAGRMPISVDTCGADAVAISACKFGGPPGVGALWLHPSVTPGRWQPVHRGGAQERGRRPGTENLVGIAGLGAAAEVADVAQFSLLRALRDGLEAGLLRDHPGAVVHGASSPRLANTTFAAFPGVDVQLLLMLLDQDGVAASSGSACVSGAVKASHVLTAMGVAPSLAACSVRFSLGPQTTSDDVAEALRVLQRSVPRARVG